MLGFKLIHVVIRNQATCDFSSASEVTLTDKKNTIKYMEITKIWVSHGMGKFIYSYFLNHSKFDPFCTDSSDRMIYVNL